MGHVYRLIETVRHNEQQNVDQARNAAHRAQLQCQSLIDKTRSLVEQEAELRSQLASTQAQLQHLLAPHTRDEPVTASEERALHAIVQHKLSQSDDGLLRVCGERGRCKTLLPLTVAEVGSSAASSRTLLQRSATVEKAMNLSSVGIPTQLQTSVCDDDLTAQRACLIRRHPDQFVKAAKQAGLNIIGKVQLTTEALAALKGELPLAMLRMLKRLFEDELGIDIFGPLDKIGQKLEAYKFTYEYGTVAITSKNENKEVKFLRVTDVADVVKSTYMQLNERGLLVQPLTTDATATRWMASGDKGGKSTKLILQCLNAAGAHSVRHARLLAYFEGSKDTHDPVQEVFGPVLHSLYDVLHSIDELKLPAAPHQPLSTVTCRLCTAQPPQGVPGDIVKTATLVHGGDWLYQAALLGLTGPNGDHFCSKCLVRLRDMNKGAQHSFAPIKCLPGPVMAIPIDAPARTLLGIRQDHERYIASGAVKGKGAEFNNCEKPVVIKGNGPVVAHFSCMPLHISLGLGTQVLDIIESEALKLDAAVKKAEGKITPEVTAAYSKRQELHQEISRLCSFLAVSPQTYARTPTAVVVRYEDHHGQLKWLFSGEQLPIRRQENDKPR